MGYSYEVNDDLTSGLILIAPQKLSAKAPTSAPKVK